MRRRDLLVAGAAVAAAGDCAGPSPPPWMWPLVLAVDVSRSITEDEAQLQREGYRNGMTDPGVLAAIANGAVGAVAVAYVEWGAVRLPGP